MCWPRWPTLCPPVLLLSALLDTMSRACPSFVQLLSFFCPSLVSSCPPLALVLSSSSPPILLLLSSSCPLLVFFLSSSCLLLSCCCPLYPCFVLLLIASCHLSFSCLLWSFSWPVVVLWPRWPTLCPPLVFLLSCCCLVVVLWPRWPTLCPPLVCLLSFSSNRAMLTLVFQSTNPGSTSEQYGLRCGFEET